MKIERDPRSTHLYLGGPDITITRAHIDAMQAERVKRGVPPADADYVTFSFIRSPKPRHFARAQRIINKVEAGPTDGRKEMKRVRQVKAKA